MMNLSPEIMALINRTIQAASSMGIEDLLITKDLIKGADKDRTCFMFDTAATGAANYDLPDLALTRVSKIKNRLAMAEKQAIIPTYTVKTDRGTNFIDQLKFTGKKLDMTYRCGAPFMVEGPSKVGDQMTVLITLSEEDIELITRAKSAVDTQSITFNITPECVRLSFTDAEGDVVTHTSDCVPQIIDPDFDATNMVFKRSYSLQKVISALKAGKGTLVFGKGKNSTGGLLFVSVNDIFCIILPSE